MAKKRYSQADMDKVQNELQKMRVMCCIMIQGAGGRISIHDSVFESPAKSFETIYDPETSSTIVTVS